MPTLKSVIGLAGALLLAASPALLRAENKAGYYYPDIVSEEVFERDISRKAPDASRAVRVNFVTQVTRAQLAAPAAPQYAVFAKGERAQHMIIVGLDGEAFKTLYRARAKLAQLTANARGTDFFRKNGISLRATWFDLAKLLDFEDVVISDGETWSHRVVLNMAPAEAE